MTTWTANDVLDTYADLVRRLRHPAGDMASFIAFQMNRNWPKKDTQYYPVMPTSPGRTATSDQGGEFARILGTGLVGAPVYQVTRDMCHAIDAMFARTVAESAPVIYEASLPASAGFVWLDQRAELEASAGPPYCIQAISWAAHNALLSEGSAPVLRIALWILASDIHEGDDGITPSSPEVIADLENRLGALTMLFTDIYLLNKPNSSAATPSQTSLALVAYLNMLWMMLQMEITGVDRATGIRGARRRAKRDAGQSDVLVVTLRRARARETDAPGGEHRDVDWSHRWLVQPHYRHHVAPPRTDWHHAIPAADKKHCAVCGGEVSYVMAYIKGPDGKPIKIRQRLHRLAR